jgi:hypothetical protein
MSMFRAKKLDLGCFTNIKIIRDHSKRKAFAAAEPERCRFLFTSSFPTRDSSIADRQPADKPSATSSATPPCLPEHVPSLSCN